MSKCNQAIILAKQQGYFLSDDGLLFSPKRELLKVYVNNTGYYKRYFAFNKKEWTYILIHRLQAYQKFGDKLFAPGIEVRHLDGNKLNNSWANIEIGTKSDNRRDIPEEILKHISRKSAKNKRKLNDTQVRTLRQEKIQGVSYNKLCSKYNLDVKTVFRIVKHKTYEDVK